MPINDDFNNTTNDKGASLMPTKMKFLRMTAGTVAAIFAALVLALPAGAHVTVSPTEAPAEGYAKLDFGVGHGCEASPTTSISVQMPDQVVSATPQVVPGWKIVTKEGDLAKPVESHGETITTGVREVTWQGGSLDAHHLGVFGLNVRFVGEVGDVVPFKVVQRCREGEHAWIEIAEQGGPEPESPAPTVTLTAAEDDHGHAASDTHEAEANGEVAVDEGDDEVPVEASSGDSDGGNGPMPAIALVVAVIALITSGVSLTRRK